MDVHIDEFIFSFFFCNCAFVIVLNEFFRRSTKKKKEKSEKNWWFLGGGTSSFGDARLIFINKGIIIYIYI